MREAAPRRCRDAEWGERYFHIIDLDGHELSFARKRWAYRNEYEGI